jgi:hypothetical protein
MRVTEQHDTAPSALTRPPRRYVILVDTSTSYLPPMNRAIFTLCVVLIPAALHAQSWNYPAFQPPRIESREFNFGVADAGRGGTTLIVQWRELMARRSQITLEGGLIAGDGGNSNLLALGGTYAYEIHRASSDVPLDFLFTLGAGLALGDATALRVPAGVSLGYRIELDREINLTPYVHPRLSLDVCDCGDTDVGLGVNFDVGANLDLTRAISVRAAAFFGGGELFGRNGIGLSIAWRPPGLRR